MQLGSKWLSEACQCTRSFPLPTAAPWWAREKGLTWYAVRAARGTPPASSELRAAGWWARFDSFAVTYSA